MDSIEAQGTRLIVDSSAFEMLSVRDPFMPQVPREETLAPRVEPASSIEVSEPVVPINAEEPPAKVLEPENILPPAPAEPLPNLNILGLIWDTDRPQAIINGQIVGIGDVVSEVKIIDIQKTGIKVLFQGRTETLEMKPKL